MNPLRVQLSRRKGSKLPPGARRAYGKMKWYELEALLKTASGNDHALIGAALAEKLAAQVAYAKKIGIAEAVGDESKSKLERRAPGFQSETDKRAAELLKRTQAAIKREGD